MLLDDVRSALEACAAQVPSASVATDQVLARARRTARRRRVTRVTALSAAVAMVIAGVAVAVAAANSPGNRVVVISEPTTSTSTTTPPAVPFSAVQLRAHVGEGAPTGWGPVDGGAARLFVPGEWIVEDGSSCIGESTTGMVGIGHLAESQCRPASEWPIPAEAVSIVPWTAGPTGPLHQVVHGYRVYREAPTRADAAWTVYVVPSLGAEIALRGTHQAQILDTLAPSSRAVALVYATQPVPKHGHVVTGDGVTLTIPGNWAVETPDGMPCQMFAGFPGERPALVRVRPGLPVPSCPYMLERATNLLFDGVYLYTSPPAAADNAPSGLPIASLRHGDSTLRVYAEPGNSKMLDVFVTRDRSPTTHVLYLGLGRDGRIAGGVLASIAAVS